MSTTRTNRQPAAPAAMFRLAPEYRRIGYYLVVGFLIVVSAAIVLGLAGLFVFAVLFLLPAFYLFRWALRVDQQGVWQRYYSRWHLWSWEAFAGGTIRAGSDLDSFVDPNKPWWSRTLVLGCLADRDRAVVARSVNEVWKPPAPLPLPNEIVLRGWFGPGRCLHLTAEGIRITGRAPGATYAWQQLARVHIVRMRHDRQDFRELSLFLSGQQEPLKLRSNQGNPNWTGPAAEVILRYVQAYAPADRLEFSAVKGPPQTLGEVQWRLVQLDRRGREYRQLTIIVPALGSLAWLLFFGMAEVHRHSPLHWDWVRWLAFCLYSVVIATLTFGTLIAARSQRARTQAEREELTIYRSSFERNVSR